MISQQLLYFLKRLSLFGLLIILMLAFTGTTQAEPIYSSDIPAVRSSLVFATIYPHDVAQTLTINNMGTAPLNITTSITPAFSHFTVSPTSITVASNNGHQALTVTCQGNTVGTYTGTLIVNHDASGSPATYPLSCTVSNKVNNKVGKADQTILFPPLPPTRTFVNNDRFIIHATGGGSNNPVTFSVTGTCIFDKSDNTVHFTGAGNCTIQADQKGNDNYNPAPPVLQTLTIGQASQTITFPPLPPKTYGDPDFVISATGGESGNPIIFNTTTGPCTVSGNIVHILGIGNCTIQADQAGNNNYLAATSVSQTFMINKANQTILFLPLPTKTYGAPDFAISATGGGSGNPITFNIITGPCTVVGNTVHILGIGNCTIQADQAGNDNYNPAPSMLQTFVIRENPPGPLPLCKFPYVLINGKCVRQTLPELPKCGPGEELKGDICIPTDIM